MSGDGGDLGDDGGVDVPRRPLLTRCWRLTNWKRKEWKSKLRWLVLGVLWVEHAAVLVRRPIEHHFRGQNCCGYSCLEGRRSVALNERWKTLGNVTMMKSKMLRSKMVWVGDNDGALRDESNNLRLRGGNAGG